ncbi:hypothetical protein D3C76_1707980 [compost metagenome]
MERCRAVLLEEEVTDPGKAVTRHRQGPQQHPGSATNGQRQYQDDQRRADKMQTAAGTVAVFAEVIRVELSETVESFDVFHDCDLCGYCSGCKLFCG